MFGGFLDWTWTTRYTRSLEAEVVRLRAENLALMNSILGVAGVPPLRIDGPRMEPAGRNIVHRDVQAGARLDDGTASNGASSRKSAAGPVRRRSWQQIGRVLEVEDASRHQDRSHVQPRNIG